MFITDDDAEKALDWLRDNAPAIGKAKESLVRAEHAVKRIKALEMKRHDGPVSAQEREAVASKVYEEACNDEAVAAGEYAKLMTLKDAAVAKIDAWRSIRATERATRL